jgi:ribosome-associated heat shock protein Hsp15
LSLRQRLDVWLWRTRLAKSRSWAASLILSGNVRIMRIGQSRRPEKPAALIEAGDAVLLPCAAGIRSFKVVALPTRRGPAAEAMRHYVELDAGAELA